MRLRPVRMPRHRDRRFLGINEPHSRVLTSVIWLFVSSSTGHYAVSSRMLRGIMHGVIWNVAEPVAAALGLPGPAGRIRQR